ncbi:MAG: hypothetical protein V2A58_11835 [Planctomycetota bacterium]
MSRPPQAVHYACDLCRKTIPDGEHFVVKIEVMASAELAPVSEDDLARDHREEIRQLLDRMSDMDTRRLEDEVHREFRFDLCGACHREYLRDPLQGRRREECGEGNDLCR